MMRFNKLKNLILVSSLILSGMAASAQSYNVDLNMTPQQMVQNLVGNGVQISNVVVTACDSTYGYYNSVGTEIGTNQGLLLTTGKALYSIGPNNSIGNCSTSAGTCDYFDNNCPGSALLNQAQNRVTHDATTFEFDIVPQGDSLKFKYTFASEEYNEWINSPFNDVFGFYITGPNIGTDVNIALLPNTSQIVAINTVNYTVNAQYFQNNTLPLGQFIQYDGFTKNLTAKVGNLIPCATYHLKLVIADATDHVYDSGVFINAIESNPVVILTATSNGLDYMVEGCNTGTVTFAREQATPDAQDVIYWVGGTATNGVDYTPTVGSGIPLDQNTITIPANATSVSFDINAALDGLPEGQEYLTIYLSNPLCTGNQILDSLNFYIYDFLDINITPDSAAICAGQCVELTGSSTLESIAEFAWTGDVSDPNSLIVEVCPTETSTYTLRATVGACDAVDSITVTVSNISVDLTPTDVNCEGGSAGSMTATVIDAVEPYTYSWTGPDGFTSSDATITNLSPGQYCLDLTDGAGCIASACENIVQTNELTATSVLSDFNCSQVSCYNSCDGSVNITVDGGVFPYTYSWSGANGYTSSDEDATGLCAGSYDLTIIDNVGCQYTNSYTLTQPDSVVLVVVGSVDLLCTGVETGQASVAASGGCSPYTYSWSHDPSVTGPVAIELGSGTYTVNVTDQNGCANTGSATIVINDPIDPLTVTIDEISVYPGGFSVSCPGATDGYINITLAGGSQPYEVEWFSVTTNSVFSIIEDLVDAPCGEYALTVMDGNGCVYTQSLQLTCVPAITVEYDVVNNTCGGESGGAGSVTITSVAGGQGAPYTYSWTGPDGFTASTANISNLNSGDYILTASDAQGCSTTITANIGANDSFTVTSTVTDASCNNTCDGAIDLEVTGGSGGGGAPTMILDASTFINICFTATHTFVSDLAFHLVGPPSCGSPDILLAPNPGTSCNSGNNLTGLCFSNFFSTNFNVCTATAPLGGIFGSYGAASTPINWNPIYGCDATQAGWTVQIYDCVGLDVGSLTDATLSFNGVDSNGAPLVIQYTTPPGFNSPINDNSCDPLSASIFQVEGGSTGGGGGGGSFTYDWTGPNGFTATSQDVTNLCPGDYSVVVTSGNCNETLNFTIANPEPLNVTAVTVVNPTCFGQNNGSIDIAVSGGSGNYTYNWQAVPGCFFFGSTNQNISGLAECTYSVIVTDVASGCTGQLSVTLEAPQVMDIVVVTSNYNGGFNVSCNGLNDGAISVFVTGGTPDCVQFDPYCYHYDWITDCSDIDPALYGNDPNAPTATNLPGGAYGINVTDANGCLATTCIDLLEPQPLDTAPVIQNIDCNQPTGCITPNITGGSNFYISYEWTGNIGNNDPNATTLCNLEAGQYTLTVTDSNNCENTFDFNIDETPSPVANITSSSDATCNGVCDGTVSVDLTGGVGPFDVSLDNQPIPTPVFPATIEALCAGQHTINIIDSNDCSTTIDFTINEPEAILIDLVSIFQEPTQVFPIQCAGDSTGAIDATVTGGTGAYTYTWTNEFDQIIANTQDIDSLKAGNYCLTVLDENLCTAQECFIIAEPDSLLQGDGVTSVYNTVYGVSCFGASDGSIDITITGGVQPYTYSWLGNNTISTDEDQTNLTAGHYEVLIVDANFCQLTLSFDLTEPTPINVDPTIASVSCFGSCDGSINIDVSGGDPTYTFAWAGPNGFNSNSEDISDLCAGTYFLTVTDANGCTSTQSFDITQPEALEGTITSQVNCSTGVVTLCVAASGGTGPYTYNWTNGEITQCIDVNVDGEYCVTVTDANGCSIQVCFTANSSSPLDITATTTIAACGQCNGTIDATVTGGTGPYSYSWSNDQLSEDLSNLCSGDYILTVTDDNDCTASESFAVSQSLGVEVNASSQDVRCFNDNNGSVSVEITSGTEPYSVVWTDQDGNIVENTDALGAGTYSVVVTDASGCIGSAVAPVVHEPAPMAFDEIKVSIHDNYNITSHNGSDGFILVHVIGGTEAYSYDWSPISVNDTVTHPQNLVAGDYTVVVTDQNGCKIDTVITLTDPDNFKLYTALSPNGDGSNDTYVIDGISKCDNNEFKVFNRWGSLVYDKKNYANEWYGQDKDGGTLADGTYFITFEGCDIHDAHTYVDLRRE